MVYFLNGGYLGEDLHGEERGQEWLDDRNAGGDISWREMRRWREWGEEEERHCGRTGIRVGSGPTWCDPVPTGQYRVVDTNFDQPKI
jgi:hypothetical protein